MATFAPQIGSNIGFEQPVQQPSGGGIADLLGMAGSFFPEPKKAKEPKEPSKTDILADAKQRYYNDLQTGRALMEQGKTKDGQRIITSAYRAFARDYGREHEDINTSFQDASGISFDVEVTGSAFDSSKFTESEDYNIRVGVLQAQNPGASQDQIFQAAMQQTLEAEQTNLRIK